MSHTIFHQVPTAQQPLTTIEEARRRRIRARRTVAGFFDPSAVRPQLRQNVQSGVSQTQGTTSPQGEGQQGQDQRRPGSNVFDEASALDVLAIAGFSPDLTVQGTAQIGSIIGSFLSPIFSQGFGVLGGVAGAAGALSNRGTVLGIPGSGIFGEPASLVGRGSGRPAARVPTGMLGGQTALSPFESQTLETQIGLNERFDRDARDRGFVSFGDGGDAGDRGGFGGSRSDVGGFGDEGPIGGDFGDVGRTA